MQIQTLPSHPIQPHPSSSIITHKHLEVIGQVFLKDSLEKNPLNILRLLKISQEPNSRALKAGELRELVEGINVVENGGVRWIIAEIKNHFARPSFGVLIEKPRDEIEAAGRVTQPHTEAEVQMLNRGYRRQVQPRKVDETQIHSQHSVLQDERRRLLIDTLVGTEDFDGSICDGVAVDEVAELARKLEDREDDSL